MLTLALALTISLSRVPIASPQADPALQHELYRAQMAAAGSAMRLGEHAAAREWLGATAPGQRGFEWRVLDATLDESSARFAISGGHVTTLAVSADGASLACGTSTGGLELRAASDGAVLWRVDAHREALTDVAFDRTGALLATTSYDRQAKVWRATDGQPVAVFSGHGYPVGGAAFAPDGSFVASCAYERPEGGVTGTVYLWNPADGALVRPLEGGRKPLVALAVAPDGSRIAAASWDFCVFVWDVAGGVPRKLAVPDEGIYNAVDGVAWSPDGALLAGASKDKTARVWNAATGELVATLRGHTDQVAKLAFSPDGTILVTASRDATLRLWNASDWTLRAALLGHADDVVDVAFAPDGARVWSASLDGTVRSWDAATTWYSGVKLQATHAAYVVRWSPDGQRLASCSYDGRVQLWSASTWELLVSFQAHPADSSCHMLDWTPDGRLLVTGSYDHTVRLWDSVTLVEVGCLRHEDGLYYMRLSPDGRRLAAVHGSKVTVWDVGRREPVHTFAEHRKDVLAVAFSSDSSLCVSAARDGRALVWAADTGAVRCEIPCDSADVAEAMFTPDGAHVVVAERGGRVRLCNLADGTVARELVRHRHGIDHIDLAPGGSRVALAAEAVTLVDLARGGIVGSFRPHLDRPYNVAFDPRGERLASCSTDRSIAVVDTRSLRERLRARDAACAERAAVEPELDARLTAGESLAQIADAVIADLALAPDRRAAWIEVLTRRAAVR